MKDELEGLLKNPESPWAYDILESVSYCPNLFKHLKESGKLEEFVNDLARRWREIVSQQKESGVPDWLAQEIAWQLIGEEIGSYEKALSSRRSKKRSDN